MIRQVVFFLLIGSYSSLYGQFQTRLNFNAKFEPTDKVLHGAGQSDEFAFASYTEIMTPARHPIFYMDYIGAKDTPDEIIEKVQAYKAILSNYPDDVGLQLGLSMTSGGTGYTSDVNSGVYDDNLTTLAKCLDSLNRQVFVRIGYEANGFWNNYSATTYPAAFRHVTDIFRIESENIATVWCIHPIDGMTKIMTYYPGDDYVDWWSIDLFQPSFMQNSTTPAFLDSAEAHYKPVMIGEATPTEIGVGNGLTSWNSWYEIFFDIIRDNPVIKAFSYINRDWTYIGGQPTWKNARIQDDTIVACKYRDEMDSDLYLHSSADSTNNMSIQLASDDAIVKKNSPNTNFGNQTLLYSQINTSTGDSIFTFFKFDISSFNSDIALARLWLLGTNSTTSDISVTIYRTGTEWDEQTLTWNNAPAIQYPLDSIKVNDKGAYKLRYNTLTDTIRNAIERGETEISFTLRHPASENIEFKFHSKDRTDGYKPALQIIHNDNNLQYTGCEPPTVPTTSTEVWPVNKALRIIPNPATEKADLVMGGTLNIKSVQIYNTLGTLVRSYGTIPENQLTLDLNGFPGGIYYVRIESGDKPHTEKLILQ